MNRNDIIGIAKKAGIDASVGKTDKNGRYHPDVNAIGRSVPVEWLEKFAALIKASVVQPNAGPENFNEFIRKTNKEYADWCASFYVPGSLDDKGMKSLDGLWAWQEQEKRIKRLIAAEREACAHICDCLDAVVDKYPAACAAAIRERGKL